MNMWRDLEEVQPPKINLEDRFSTLERKIDGVQKEQVEHRDKSFLGFAVVFVLQVLTFVGVLLVLRIVSAIDAGVTGKVLRELLN